MTEAPRGRPGGPDPAKTRDPRLDIARGLAIALVVLGHSVEGTMSSLGYNALFGAMLVFVYSFHVSTFYTISGLLFQDSAKRPWPGVLMQLLRRIAWPYFIWGTILMVIQFAMNDYTNTQVAGIRPWVLLWRPASVMWFLYVLFVAMLLYRLIAPFGRGALALAGVAILLAGYFLPPGYARFAGLFLLAGLLDRRNLDALLWPPVLWAAGAVMIATLAMAIAGSATPVTGYPAFEAKYIPALFAGPALLFFLCDWIATAPGFTGLARIMTLIGRQSMAIFVLHILITAGTRIGLGLIGIRDIWLVIGLGTTLGIVFPLLLALLAQRLRLTRLLGW